MPAIKEVVSSTETGELFEKDTLIKIRDTHSKEIVVGLCGAIGAPIRVVAEALTELLEQKYSYQPEIIKLSSFIEDYAGPAPADPDKYKRYDYLIRQGNELRKLHTPALLAELAIKRIALRRAEKTPTDAALPPPVRFCHILDSLKNTGELELLRAVYGRLFIMIGVHASPEERSRTLKARGVSDKAISLLMDTDSGEDFAHGQEVRETFPLSDFFVHAGNSNTTELKAALDRILNLITNARIVTPTREETAMYHAHAAGMNSACLSRQVGAAVTDKDGSIIGLGWNDVPKANGGLYVEGLRTDHRCMHRDGGKCFNDLEKDLLAEVIADAVSEVVPSVKTARKDVKVAIRKSRIKDLIEFSRAVHAEMMAIIDAGANANGARLKGGRIFVTTYPCHSCARHIIAAGIKEVIYIEPYRKSLAIKLHSDALVEETKSSEKVCIFPFEGVGPFRYPDFFVKISDRKDKAGNMVTTKHDAALLRTPISLRSLPELEALIVKQLDGRKLVRKDDEPQKPASA